MSSLSSSSSSSSSWSSFIFISHISGCIIHRHRCRRRHLLQGRAKKPEHGAANAVDEDLAEWQGAAEGDQPVMAGPPPASPVDPTLTTTHIDDRGVVWLTRPGTDIPPDRLGTTCDLLIAGLLKLLCVLASSCFYFAILQVCA
jgi:hypothetical protein